MKSPILIIVGTRPEGIKMMPVYAALKAAQYPVMLVSTGQHATMLDEVFELFGVKPDIDMKLGKPNQDLAYVTQAVISACTKLYQEVRPSLVLVEGDTTTVMAAALSAFYVRIPVGHVEAGLRTGDIYQPYPEEFNRRVMGMIAQYHFAPTALAVANLLAEQVARISIFCTGNTIVDALRIIRAKIAQRELTIRPDVQKLVDNAHNRGSTIMVLTAHRRESFNGGIARILSAVKELARSHSNLVIIYPCHPNPQVQRACQEINLATEKNIFVTDPLSYKDLVFALDAAQVVLTDSGGIQEEAISLGKSVVVLREKTERMEGVWEGIAHLVGTDKEKIIAVSSDIIAHPRSYAKNQIYGDGYAAQKIVAIVTQPDKKDAHISFKQRSPAWNESVL